MKPMLSVFAFVLLAVACDKDDLVYEGQFDKSYREYQSFKKTAANNYTYQASFTSWTGVGHRTNITVREGIVTAREFWRIRSEHTGSTWQIDTLSTWVEYGAQVGIHDEGEPARTIDEVYEEARSNWLKKRSDAETFFEAKNNGMLSNAGYVPKGCMDDCFIGITISFIKPE